MATFPGFIPELEEMSEDVTRMRQQCHDHDENILYDKLEKIKTAIHEAQVYCEADASVKGR